MERQDSASRHSVPCTAALDAAGVEPPQGAQPNPAAVVDTVGTDAANALELSEWLNPSTDCYSFSADLGSFVVAELDALLYTGLDN